MAKRIDLSIIIVNFNTKDFLKQCFESLKRVSKEIKEQEIIVVDNGSTDGSLEMLKKFKESENQNLKIIENKNNLGFAKAVNQGIKASLGKFILLLNSDIIVKRGAIKKMVDFLQKHSEVGVVGGRLLNPDGSVQGSCFNLPTISRVIKEFCFKGQPVLNKYFPQGNQPIEVEAVQGAVFLIPRKVIDKVGYAYRQTGPFDERYFMYFEDLDFCRRVRRAGFKVYYLPKAEFIHFQGASGRKISQKTYKWLAESSKIYHGRFKYYLLTGVIWLFQKWRKILKS